MPMHLPRLSVRQSIVVFMISISMVSAACSSVKSEWNAVKSSVKGEVAEKKAAEPADISAEPSLFNVSKEQLDHLQIVTVKRESWPVSIETTGTVDLDNDHTAQAITQVNGPISRIVVDVGAQVKEGDPLLYVSSPDLVNAISAYRKARNREDANKRIVDRQKGTDGPRGSRGEGL